MFGWKPVSALACALFLALSGGATAQGPASAAEVAGYSGLYAAV